MAEVTIEATPNGPYLVTGPVELHDTDGKSYPRRARSGCAAAARRPRSRFATAPTPRLAFGRRRRPCPSRLKGADRRACDRLGEVSRRDADGRRWQERAAPARVSD
jgi:hypothetical protein